MGSVHKDVLRGWKALRLLPRTNSESPTHIMLFNDSSDVLVMHGDCVCDFWNGLDYKF